MDFFVELPWGRPPAPVCFRQMKHAWKIGLLAVGLGLAWMTSAEAAPRKKKTTEKTVPAAVETPSCGLASAASRKPVIRHLDRKIDGADLKRI